MPVTMLEEHVNSLHHPLEEDEKYNARKIFVKDYEQLYWCSEELPVQGSVDVFPAGISHPINTNFHVVCIKDRDGKYKLSWTCSLS